MSETKRIHSPRPGLAELMAYFDRADHAIATWMATHGLALLRISIGIVFIWFGGLKLFDTSPAEALVRDTVTWWPFEVFYPILAVWEMVIGACFLHRSLLRAGILLLFLQMPGTFLPLVLLPEVCFTPSPFGLTMEGQYIIKNLVLISAALVIGGTVRHRTRQDKPA